MAGKSMKNLKILAVFTRLDDFNAFQSFSFIFQMIFIKNITVPTRVSSNGLHEFLRIFVKFSTIFTIWGPFSLYFYWFYSKCWQLSQHFRRFLHSLDDFFHASILNDFWIFVHVENNENWRFVCHFLVNYFLMKHGY